ncbi:MAG TPA: hypothetical protein PLI41_04710 [Bacteroidales bacterium]|jgi:hypothetical protein|nr:hypothetical protein [Bacteroidales bacterium]HQB36830.1 hypothetical protein [Bacteroidales bacterium]
MKNLLRKLNYKQHKRITLIGAEEPFKKALSEELPDVITDYEIDPRYPYEFMIIFVRTMADVERIAPVALHNLTADGILWFCYPKKTSRKFSPGLERNKGWETLNNAGFHSIRIVSIDDDWSALRFRNVKFIKSVSQRFQDKNK